MGSVQIVPDSCYNPHIDASSLAANIDRSGPQQSRRVGLLRLQILRSINSHLYELQPLVVEMEAFDGTGGAIEPLGDKLLLVTPRGRIALIHGDGEVDYLPHRVPMNESAPDEPNNLARLSRR